MNVKKQITINAPASQLWQILVKDYDKISVWAAVVLESGPNPEVPEGEGRVCLTTLGRNKERITHMDERTRTFSYAVFPEKAPFFLKGIENTFTIEQIDNDRSEVSMNANVTLIPIIGSLVGPLMKRRMERGFGSILEELKQYAETGQIHPRKQESLGSHAE